MKIPVSASMAGMDVTGQCRIWTIDSVGDNQRMANRSKVWSVIASAINHLEGRTPRLIWGQAFDNATVQHCNSTPTFETRWIDNVVNERFRTIRVLSLPRGSDAYDSNAAAELTTNAAGATNIQTSAANPTPTWPSDINLDSITVARGNALGIVYTETISSTNGMPVVDVVAQADIVTMLDDAEFHDYATQAIAPGLQILAPPTEDCRLKFHRLRQGHNRLIACFLGVCADNAREHLTGSNAGVKGFWTNSGAYVNLLDQSITTRTATSPGVAAPGYKGGIGQSNGLGVQFYVLAAKGIGNASGFVRIVGPDHRADNDTTVEITSSDAAWYTNATPVYLNTEADVDDATTARNKLDPQFKVTTAGEEVSVYSVLGYTRQT